MFLSYPSYPFLLTFRTTGIQLQHLPAFTVKAASAKSMVPWRNARHFSRLSVSQEALAPLQEGFWIEGDDSPETSGMLAMCWRSERLSWWLDCTWSSWAEWGLTALCEECPQSVCVVVEPWYRAPLMRTFCVLRHTTAFHLSCCLTSYTYVIYCAEIFMKNYKALSLFIRAIKHHSGVWHDKEI